MTEDEYVEREVQLNRFRRLLGEVMRGELLRNSFMPWEVELLLDFDLCELPSRRRTEILRQYQRAVEKQLQCGPGPPMKLSHFLVLREQRRVTGRGSGREKYAAAVDAVIAAEDDADCL